MIAGRILVNIAEGSGCITISFGRIGYTNSNAMQFRKDAQMAQHRTKRNTRSLKSTGKAFSRSRLRVVLQNNRQMFSQLLIHKVRLGLRKD
jgi:hypothetical protein